MLQITKACAIRKSGKQSDANCLFNMLQQITKLTENCKSGKQSDVNSLLNMLQQITKPIENCKSDQEKLRRHCPFNMLQQITKLRTGSQERTEDNITFSNMPQLTSKDDN